MIDVKETLRAFCNVKGPPGYEHQAAALVRETWEPLTDTLEAGKLGDVIGIKRGNGTKPRPSIMLAGHMDEISLTVRKVEKGFVRIHSLDGMDRCVLPGQTVTVFGAEGRALPGYVGSVPPHVLSGKQRDEYPQFEDLVIDLGLPPDEVAELVRPGDPVVFDAPMLELQGSRVAAKATDDRASVLAITVCLDQLQGRNHAWDVLAVATTKEEVGSHGARAIAFQYQPNLAIALDVTFASQPGTKGHTFDLGGGPTLGLGPGYHNKLRKAIMDAAERLEMTVNVDPEPRPGGTDAAVLQISGAGIPTALIGIPVRNMHTPVEVIDLKDIERAGRLLAEFIAGLEADFVDTLVWDPDKDLEPDADADKEEDDA